MSGAIVEGLKQRDDTGLSFEQKARDYPTKVTKWRKTYFRWDTFKFMHKVREKQSTSGREGYGYVVDHPPKISGEKYRTYTVMWRDGKDRRGRQKVKTSNISYKDLETV